MLPVTRANLDHICCICLLDIRSPMFTEKVYDVKEEKNMSKVLKLTAHITVLKNPINQKYINDYCRKICEICYLKTQYSYFFREKIMASTAVLKELLESDELDDDDIKRLQHFCRICLNRQYKLNADANSLSMQQLNWLKDCSGIRYTSLIDTQAFRIKEGTNINEIVVINDKDFPKQLCQNCSKKLHNVEEFRKSATQSFEYMISVMGDPSGPDDDLVTQKMKQFKENVIWKRIPPAQPVSVNETSIKQDCAILEINMDLKYEEQQENACADVLECQIQEAYTGVDDPIVVKKSSFSNTLKLEEDAFENVMDFVVDLPHYSEDDDDAKDADFTLNFSNDEVSSGDFSDTADNCLRKTRAKKSEQCKVNNGSILSTKEELPKHRKKVELSEQSAVLCHNHEKRTRKAKQPKKTKTSNTYKTQNTDDNAVKETIICEECSQIFATTSTLKRHQKTVHCSESNLMLHICPICSKEFKRKSHFDDHIKTVHEKQRPFKCSHCPKYFATNGSKRVHELIHTDEFPFVCEWCEKRFRQAFRLKTHLEMHTTKPELLCPICKRSQKTTKDLEDHLKSHDDKRLQCPSCGKLFKRSSHLNDHYNAVHLKLRPFKCEFCESSFGDRKTRRVHEKSHTENRPETCAVCKRGFKSLSSLNKHIKQSGHLTEECRSQDRKTKKNSSKSLSQHNTENLNGVFELGSQYSGNTLTF